MVANGHEVLVQSGAGLGSSIADEQYLEAGAVLAPNAATTWATADVVLKVEEPIASEYQYFRDDLVLFTYLRLAAEEELTRALLDAGVTSTAIETVQLASRALPLLAPMSAVAGRLSAIVSANVMLKRTVLRSRVVLRH